MPNQTDYSKVAISYPKKVLVAVPPGLLEQVDGLAREEFRTRSDLIREALRRYVEGARPRTVSVINGNVTPMTERGSAVCV